MTRENGTSNSSNFLFLFIFILLLLVFGHVRGEESTSTGAQLETVTTTTNHDSKSTTSLNNVARHDLALTSSASVLRNLGPFKSLAHGVKSGEILVYTDGTILIPDFSFDGNAPDAHFSVGSGQISKGSFVPRENGVEEALTAYNGQDITLKLPQNVTLDSIEWLAIWCVVYSQNLGYVRVRKPRDYPPQVFGLDREVKSGPVILVNKTTIFIPNLRYKGGHKDAHFWIGNGSEPDKEGVLVPDEEQSSENLKSYSGANIYLTLPNGYTLDNIDYFGVFSSEENVNLGHVLFDKSVKVPLESREVGDKLLMRVPKCCPVSSMLTPDGCNEETEQIQDFVPNVNVSDHNATHLNTEPFDPGFLIFEPYYSSPKCASNKKYPLESTIEKFTLLKNGSLVVNSLTLKGILSQGSFCIDFVKTDSLVFICAPENRINQAVFHTYLTLLIISTLCFAAVFILYYFILSWDDIHKKCFCGFCFSMLMTFIFLVIVQLAYVQNKGCVVIGFFFQLSMISSFTWLSILSFDVLFMVIYYSDNMKVGTRMRWYWIIGFAVPALSLLISLARTQVPDVPNSFFKPQYGKNLCYFDADEQKRVFFYTPIGISIVASIGFLGYTKYKTMNMDKDNRYDFFWLENGVNYKFMFRQYILTLIIMAVCWISNILMSNIDDSSGIFVATMIIESLQGVLITALCAYNLYRQFYTKQRTDANSNPRETTDSNELTSLRQ